MTAPAHRVVCPCCGWVGYRRRPHSRPCPTCGLDRAKLDVLWLAGCAPHRGRCCYLVEIRPAFRHASHYLGFTADLPRRRAEHQAGNGSRLLAAALGAGCDLELVRVWYGTQARSLEQRLKQHRQPGRPAVVPRGASNRCARCATRPAGSAATPTSPTRPARRPSGTGSCTIRSPGTPMRSETSRSPSWQCP